MLRALRVGALLLALWTPLVYSLPVYGWVSGRTLRRLKIPEVAPIPPPPTRARLKEFLSTTFRPVPGTVLQAVYEGELIISGNYRRPGEERRLRSARTYTTDCDRLGRVDIRTWPEPNSQPLTRSFLLAEGKVFEKSTGRGRWVRLRGEARDRALIQIYAGAPILGLTEAQRLHDRDSSLVRFEEDPNGYWGGIELTSDPDGNPRSVWHVSLSGGRPGPVSRIHPDPRLGDVDDNIGYGRSGPDTLAAGISMRVYEADHFWEFPSRLVSMKVLEDRTGLLRAPEAFEEAAIEDWEARSIPLVHEIASGIWSVVTPDFDSRALIVEFTDHLAIIEAAGGSRNGERIVDVAKFRFPEKPIRYFLFSHHHPHSAGGVRAMIAEDAVIVTTPKNEPLVRDAARRCFLRTRDRLGTWDRIPRIELVRSQLELRDTTNHLVAVDVGSPRDSVDEFLVFWFPRQRMVFQMEHGWVRRNGSVEASLSAAELLRALRERAIAVDRIVQASPVRGIPDQLSSVKLQALVRARRR